MKRGCITYLLTWAIAAAAYWYWLRDRLAPPANIWTPVIAGFLMAIVIGAFQTAGQSMGHIRRVRRAMEPGGFMGEDPEDGETFAAIGTIRPLGFPLKAPFSGKPAVLYKYEVERPGSSNKQGTVKDYAGYALTPSVIDTIRGQVKLLCFPDLEDVQKEVAFGPEAVPNAQAYIRSTQWAALELNPTQIVREVRELMTDDDGQIRKDWSIRPNADLRDATLIEQIVPPGAQVFAIGTWSAEKRGLVPNQGVTAKLMLGDAREAIKTLRAKVRGSIIVGLIFAGVVNGILWVFVTRGPFAR